MRAEAEAPAGSRGKVLFLSFSYPSRGGSGSQLRAAALIRMLATRANVHLLVAGYSERVAGPPDAAVERLCGKAAYLRILPREGGGWVPANSPAAAAALPAMDCAPGEAADTVVRLYQEWKLDSLFVYRFDALHFIYHRLDCFPVRHLDLDELPSRREERIGGVRPKPVMLAEAKMTVPATMRVMERAILPRFHRVFVSSAVEAEEVRRQTGFPHPRVLPNIHPGLSAPLGERTAARSEILFVGSFFYYPNVDAVLYFCREILPLIQEAKGDGVLFRIIGMGSAKELEGVKNQRGVDFAGYQEDLAPFYDEAAVAVVPLRAGAGTRLKILEAFVHGRPVVSTTIGAEGLEVTDRENILLADTPEVFARACLELMDGPALAGKIREGAARLHRDLYSQEALARCYEKIIAGEPAQPAGIQ